MKMVYYADAVTLTSMGARPEPDECHRLCKSCGPEPINNMKYIYYYVEDIK